MTEKPSIDPWLTTRQSHDPAPKPALSVGTMNFGKRTSTTVADRIVRRAIERGLRFFDTANVYNGGESERILGQALGRDRKNVFIATKVGLGGMPAKPEGLSGATIASAIDESLTRLGTDYVDLYYLHAPDPKVPLRETIDAMKALLDAGKVRAWGVSNFASWQIFEINLLADSRGMLRPAVAQLLYNVLIRQLEIEYFAFARAHSIHTTVYNPLAGGLLAGAHKQGEIPKGSRFDNNGMYQRRYWTARFFELVAEIGKIAASEGMSLVDLSYAWVCSRPGVDSVLLGPGDVAQLDAGIEGADKTLSAQAMRKLDELTVAFAGTDARYAR